MGGHYKRDAQCQQTRVRMADGLRRPMQVEVPEQVIEDKHGQGERNGEFGEAFHCSWAGFWLGLP